MTRKWCVMDLVVGRDGKLVMTKVQAACFHLALFLTVVSITGLRLYKFMKSGGEVLDFPNLFDTAMWSIYGAVAVGHAVIDKTGTQVASFKMAKLETPSAAAPGTVTTEERTVKSTSSTAPLEP